MAYLDNDGWTLDTDGKPCYPNEVDKKIQDGRRPVFHKVVSSPGRFCVISSRDLVPVVIYKCQHNDG